MAVQEYNEDSIRSLDWKEHIRLRPGMYIGKMGNGSSPDDGVYILLKEVIDNSIDEFVMGNGKTIEVTVKNNKVSVRDFGRGIPLGKVIDCVSKINTGAKYIRKYLKSLLGLMELVQRQRMLFHLIFVFAQSEMEKVSLLNLSRELLQMMRRFKKTHPEEELKLLLFQMKNFLVNIAL